jgi:hypothetical protein
VNPGCGHNPSDSGDLTLAPIEKRGQRVGIAIGIESDLSLALHLGSHRVPVGIDDCPVFASVRRCHASLLNSWLKLAHRPEVGSCDDADTDGIYRRVLSDAASCLKEQGRALIVHSSSTPARLRHCGRSFEVARLPGSKAAMDASCRKRAHCVEG